MAGVYGHTEFQSTLSVRRATKPVNRIRHYNHISIHALRKESDESSDEAWLRPSYISIHALRKESDPYKNRAPVHNGISIHALRKESDAEYCTLSSGFRISIHALRKESDRAAGHFCPLSETQASCLALSISNNTTGTTNNMPKTSSCLSVSF